jgi:hypothetical protein
MEGLQLRLDQELLQHGTSSRREEEGSQGSGPEEDTLVEGSSSDHSVGRAPRFCQRARRSRPYRR